MIVRWVLVGGLGWVVGGALRMGGTGDGSVARSYRRLIPLVLTTYPVELVYVDHNDLIVTIVYSMMATTLTCG